MIYAEELNFWQTSKSSPDIWVERTTRQIEALGGKILADGFGSTLSGAAFMIGFALEGETFKIVWPVLPTKSGNARAAKVQAATMLYHYIKGVALYALVVGSRTAFFSHLLLPDGKTLSELTNEEIEDNIFSTLQLMPGDDL